jgi:hypothetical protein
MQMPAMISLKVVCHQSLSLTNGLTRPASSGSALLEYVVPAVALLVSAGVFMTLINTSGLMSDLYLASSGRTSSSLAGTKLQTKGLGESAYGDVDNGLGGFTSFGTLSPVAGTSGTQLYIGQVSRGGGRTPASNPDYLFP